MSARGIRHITGCRGAHTAVAPVVLLAMLCGLGAVTAHAQGPSIGQFELKTLDSEPGSVELQSQNAYASGHPPRMRKPTENAQADGGWHYDDNTVTRLRSALEAEVGWLRQLKSRVGIELEDERIDDPSSPAEADAFAGLALTEVGAEIIGILVPRQGNGLGLGAVVEYEHPILSASDEPKKLVLGPVVEAASGRLTAAAIPMLVHAFGAEDEEGHALPSKWDFAYALQLAYRLSHDFCAALEAYGTLDRLADGSTTAGRRFGDFDQHRVGPIIYYAIDLGAAPPADGEPGQVAREGDNDEQDLEEEDQEGAQLSLGFGLLLGVNDNTSDVTLKLSLELDL